MVDHHCLRRMEQHPMAALAGVLVLVVAGLVFLGLSRLAFLIAGHTEQVDGDDVKLWILPIRNNSTAQRNRVAGYGALVVSVTLFVYAGFLLFAAIVGWELY